MEIAREVEIARPVADVFAFVSDPLNDPRWCRKVRSVEEVGPGRYAVVHKPVPGKPERRLEMTRVGCDEPVRVAWHEDDGVDVFEVTYSLTDLGGGRTRMRQVSRASLAAPRLLRPLYRLGIGRDVAGQLRTLKKLLERAEA